MPSIPDTSTVPSSCGSPTDDAPLRQSEERFSKAFHFAPIPTSLTRISDGMMLDANSSLCDLFGLAREEIIGRTALELGVWQEEAERGLVLKTLADEGRVTDLQMRVSAKGGEVRDVLVSAVTFDLEGEPCMLSMARDVTERKRAEEALRQSEEKYRGLVENLHEGVWATDKDSRTTFVNSRMAAMLGYTCEEMMGQHLFTLMDEQGAETARQGIERRRRGIAEQQDFEFLRKDGSRLCVTMAITPLTDANGEYAGALAGMLDLTDRKAAEEALQKSEERFRTLAVSAPIGIMLIDNRDGLVYCNRRFLDIFRLPWEKSAAFGWVKSLHPDDREAFLAHRSKAMAEGRKFIREFRIVTLQGETRWLSVHTTPLLSQDGVSNTRVGTLEDITDRKQAEDALRESEERFRMLAASVPVGIFQTDAEGKIEYANQRVLKITGLTALEETADWRWGIDPHPDDREAVLAERTKAMAEGRVFLGDFRISTPQGVTRWVETRICPLFNEKGEQIGHAGMVEDVTERRQAEEALRESEERFRMLAASVPVGIFQTDAEGKIEYVNQRVLKITGLTALEETADWRWGIDPHPDDREAVLAERTKAMAEGRVFLGDFRILTPQGVTRWVDTRNSPLFNEKGEQIGRAGMVEDVTERRQAEEALRESESRFRQVLELSSDLIYRLDLESRTYDYVSPSVLRLSGFTEKEFTALGIHGIRHRVHPEDWPEFKRRLEKVLERRSDDGEARRHEYRWQSKDGEYRWFQESVVLVRGNDGRPLAMVGAVRDITERKRGEEELQKSVRLLRDTGEMAKVGGWELDLSTKEVSWTEEVGRIHGVEPGYEPDLEEALNFYAPESRPAVEAAVKKAAQTGEPYDFESLFIPLGSKDKIWVRALGKAVYSGGKIVKLAGTFQNIDKYKRADEALRKSEEQHRILFETIAQGIVYQSADGGIISANPAAERILGLTIDQMRGRTSVDPHWKAIHEDGSDFPGETHASMTALKTGREVLNVVMGVFNPKDDRHRWININAIPLFRPGEDKPHQVYTTFEDITEHREAVERERRLHEQEARTRELRTAVRVLEQMAATLAHELRNPLGVISNSAYFLSNQSGIENPKARKHAEIISREVQSAKRVIDDILEFARIPQIMLAPASLNVIVEQTLARSQIPANIRVTHKLTSALPPLVCDSERLERAFLDVVANAVQAMPSGGCFSIRTRLSGDTAVVVFSDTGEGIARQNLARVFEPMFTTKLRGVGLGLTVVHRTVDEHGGRVDIKSRQHRGTNVTITLPLARVDAAKDVALTPS